MSDKILNVIRDLTDAIMALFCITGLVALIQNIYDLDKSECLNIIIFSLFALLFFKINLLKRNIEEKERKELEKRIKDFDDRIG